MNGKKLMSAGIPALVVLGAFIGAGFLDASMTATMWIVTGAAFVTAWLK